MVPEEHEPSRDAVVLTTRQEVPRIGTQRGTYASPEFSRDVARTRTRTEVPRIRESVSVAVATLAQPLPTAAPIVAVVLKIGVSSEAVESLKQTVIAEEVRLFRQMRSETDRVSQRLRREDVIVEESGT